MADLNDKTRLTEIMLFAGIDSAQATVVAEELLDERYIGTVLWETFLGRLYTSMLRVLIGEGVSIVDNPTILEHLEFLHRMFPDHPGLRRGVPVLLAALREPQVGGRMSL